MKHQGISLRYLVPVCSLLIALLSAVPHAAASPIVIAGTTYDTANFADTLLSSSSTGGSFTLGGTATTLDAAVTGFDLDTWAFCNCSSSYVQLGFTDNVVTNGAGADLALFELGTPDNFGIALTIGGVTQTIVSTATGFTQGQGFEINVAQIDLSDFGVAPGATVDSIVVGMGFPFGKTSSSPTLAAVTGLDPTPVNVVPEPSSIILFSTGLAATAGISRNRRKKPTPGFYLRPKATSESPCRVPNEPCPPAETTTNCRPPME